MNRRDLLKAAPLLAVSPLTLSSYITPASPVSSSCSAKQCHDTRPPNHPGNDTYDCLERVLEQVEREFSKPTKVWMQEGDYIQLKIDYLTFRRPWIFPAIKPLKCGMRRGELLFRFKFNDPNLHNVIGHCETSLNWRPGMTLREAMLPPCPGPGIPTFS
jgi:hypothetical protein